MYFFVGLAFFIIGGLLNIFQAIISVTSVETLGDMPPVLVMKIITIFMGPVGSIWGWIDLFAGVA
jgi:hypothetical protein